MHDSLDASGSRRNIQRRAMDHRLARFPLAAIPDTAIVIADSPVGIVRRSSHHADLVSALCEPDRHLAGIFPNSRKFGRVVQPVDEDSQTLPFIGSSAACRLPMIN